MITNTSTLYAGRLVDLSLFPGLNLPGTPEPMTVGGTAKVTAGASKAVQGFTLSLLSPQGANIEDPTMGTNFSSRMGYGGVKYPSDVAQAFAIEASKAMDWWNFNSKTRPLDEQIKSVDLTGQNIGATSISLSIKVTTKSETDISFLLPVKWSN
jgi:hypothetical protein